MPYIVVIVIALIIISALINWVKEHIKGFSIFVLIVGSIVGLYFLNKNGIDIIPIIQLIIIGIIAAVIIYKIVKYVRKVRLKTLENNINYYMSQLGYEGNYQLLKDDMYKKFGHIKIGDVNSNDLIEDNLKSYVKRNIDVIKVGIEEIVERSGMISQNDLYNKANSTYGNYCIGDCKISGLCLNVLQNCQKYPLDNGEVVYSPKDAIGGTDLTIESFSDEDFEDVC